MLAIDRALESLVEDVELLSHFIGTLGDSTIFENLDDLEGCESSEQILFRIQKS